MLRRPLPLLVGLSMIVINLAVALPARAQNPAVTGAVTYLVRSALPAEAVVTVRLSDVSKADAPAEVIAEQTIPTEGKQVPFPYTLTYDASKIIDNHDYAVSARIESGGQLLFVSTQRYAVITKGNPTENVEVIVEPVGATANPPTALPTSGSHLLTVVLALAGVLLGVGGVIRRAAK